jgi:putative ABC transport system permease protein
MSRSRIALLGLLARQFGGQRAAASVIVATVAGIAFLCVAAPRAMDDLVSRELAYEIGGLPAASRDLSASPVGLVALEQGSSIEDVWGATVASAESIRQSIPPAARGLLSEGHVAASTGALSTGMSGYELGATDPVSRIGLVAGPDVLDHVTIVDGAMPTGAEPETEISLRPGRTIQDGDLQRPVEIVLSTAAASTLNWPIGQVRKATPEITNNAPYFVLTGTFEPLDPGADYWQHMPATTLGADVFDDGNRRPIATATAIVSPLTWPTVGAIYNYGPTTIQRLTVWFPLDASAISGPTANDVLDELRQTEAKVVQIGDDGQYVDAPRSAFTTAVVDRLEVALGRSDATTSVLLVAASGPLAVAIAVLALASRLITQRRRDTLSLVASRGGSDLQLRGVLAAEGLAYGLPSALGGAAIGIFLFPSAVSVFSVVAAGIAAFAPAFILALSATPGSLRRARSDITTTPRTRVRVIVDLVISVLAIVAVVVIGLRGATATGVDPMLVAAPVLVAVAASLAVLRLYPVPMRLIERVLARRTESAALLGAMRGSRDPAAGLAPVLAMIVAVSVAAFAGTMVATLSAGTVAAAQERVGGDVRLAGPQFVDQSIKSIRAINGVTSAQPIEVIGSGTLTAGRTSIPIEIIVADTAALSAQQSGIAGASPAVPEATGDALVVVASTSLASKFAADDDLRLGSRAISVFSTAIAIAGSDAARDWILIDISQRTLLARDGFAPRTMVITTSDDAATSAVLDWARATYGVGVQTATESSSVSDIRASPFVLGLSNALLVVIVLVALLCTFCVVLMMTIGTAERGRLLALLRTLGFSRSQSRTLIAWELGPVAAVALAAGALLGIFLPLLVLAGVNVTPFTGGGRQPGLVVDPLTLVATVGGFVAIVVAATLIAFTATRDTPIASALRSGEE